MTSLAFITSLTWKKARAWLLATLILLFSLGVFILMHTGKQYAPITSQAPSIYEGDFGKYLADHHALLVPFFDKNRQDIVKQGVPLLIQVMGDIILLNMAIGWVLDIGLGFGFSFMFAPMHAKPQEAVIYASWRLGLDIIVFLMGSFGSFGLEQLQLPIPIWSILILFVAVDILVQSVLVATIYGTGPFISTMFYIALVVVHLLVGALISGALIKTRVAVMLAQFVDIQNVTLMLQTATSDSRHELEVDKALRDQAKQDIVDAQAKLDEIQHNEDALHKDIEAKQNSEAFVYGRIMRMRAHGDLTQARDQLIAFLAKFPSGTLVSAANGQMVMINQELADQETEKKKAIDDAALAKAQARADLIGRAKKTGVTLSEVRHSIIGKERGEVIAYFGPPTETASDRWGYANKIVLNPLTNEKFGLAIYFSQGVVQSVDYYYNNPGGAQ